ncbi:MAG TPA: dihydrodipicolinate synthase family protein [Vicinamibacteria bacterium]|nr:dihydrodipicolinate synthase family protein [Vicinamibacteria bacterium]
MKTTPLGTEDLRGVLAVPPLARRPAVRRDLDFAQNDRLLRHMLGGGLRRFLYGGNAFLYHVTLAEYEAMLDWLTGFPADAWAIPSVGPSFGRALDQAPLLRRRRFPVAMALPCADPRDARGLEAGLREVAEAAGLGLIVYLKDEGNFGPDKDAGLDAVARLVDSGVCVAIKYAVVRPDPTRDPYLEGLLRRVDRRRVVSGMGERPAVAHMQGFSLPGFTTGSGCLAPGLSEALFESCVKKDWAAAEEQRRAFLPLEDQRDAWGPARVLHAALELAGVAETGPIPPFVSALSEDRRAELEPTARTLLGREREKVALPAGAEGSGR